MDRLKPNILAVPFLYLLTLHSNMDRLKPPASVLPEAVISILYIPIWID